MPRRREPRREIAHVYLDVVESAGLALYAITWRLCDKARRTSARVPVVVCKVMEARFGEIPRPRRFPSTSVARSKATARLNTRPVVWLVPVAMTRPAGLNDAPRPSLRLHCQQRDALYAEFLAGATRVVRDELVGRIVLDFDHLHAGRCDLAAIVVLLGGSANAGGP